MNYAVYTYQQTDAGPQCRIIAYQIVSTEGGMGITLMDQSAAEALAQAITKADPKITTMVLALETDREITAA